MRSLPLGIAVLMGAACAGARTVRAWPVEPKNPTRWTFDIDARDARTLVLAKFCLEEDPLWIAWGEPPAGEDIRLRPDVLGWVGSATYLSPVYHTSKGPCLTVVWFRVHLTAASPGRTAVEVTAEGMRVVSGMTSGLLNPHGPHRIMESAQPTTVEEYTVLRGCGEAFGVPLPETHVSTEGIAALVRGLAADDTRTIAGDSLVFLGGPDVTECLVAALERDGPEAQQAAYTLGRLRAAAALPALERACKSRRRDVRESAAEAIRAIRRREPSVDDLVAQLMSKAATDRLDAAIALVSTGREVDRARPVLEPFLASEIPSERWRAAAALVRMRRASAPGAPPH